MVVFACHILTKRVEEDLLSILSIQDSDNVGDSDSCIKKNEPKIIILIDQLKKPVIVIGFLYSNSNRQNPLVPYALQRPV
jgi:hypothetical protein